MKISEILVVKNSLIKRVRKSLVVRLAKPGLKKARKASQFSKR
ncbi:TPA: hypothetical protein ACYQCX_000408 [Streptococcus pneumoniae]|nr:hypothetical protein [Streptococcus pneumoniae]